MSILKEIINGHINEFKSIIGTTSEEQEKVFNSRNKICLNCPLKVGNTCNKKMGIHPVTLETTTDIKKKSEGYNFGCGCRLSAKIRSTNPATKCPAGFWGGEFN